MLEKMLSSEVVENLHIYAPRLSGWANFFHLVTIIIIVVVVVTELLFSS